MDSTCIALYKSCWTLKVLSAHTLRERVFVYRVLFLYHTHWHTNRHIGGIMGSGVLPKKTSTCGLGKLGIEPPTFQLADNFSSWTTAMVCVRLFLQSALLCLLHWHMEMTPLKMNGRVINSSLLKCPLIHCSDRASLSCWHKWGEQATSHYARIPLSPHHSSHPFFCLSQHPQSWSKTGGMMEW